MIGDLVRVRYEITEALSSSSIFDSFVARDRVRNIDVCIRLVKPPFALEPEFVLALGRVVERTKALDHPNIARVYEIDEHEGRPFVVCELIRGATMGDRIKRLAPFSPSVAVEMAIGICEALESAAAQGVLHGDLCADHVVATLDGRVAVLDFGLWESYSSSESAGAIVLARMAPYLAPEVIAGEMPSYASDVYAAGVVLFELLTGLLPFSGLTPAAVIAKHATQPVPSARGMNPAVPAVLDEIVQKALAKDKRERYASASSLVSDLRKLLDALRFGRKLDWPLGDGKGQDDLPRGVPAKTFVEKRKEQQQVEPKGRQARTQPKQTRRIPLAAEAGPDDVPWWLRALAWAGGGMVALLIIFWIYFNLTTRKTIPAPNFIGKSMTEARQQAQVLGVELVNDGEEFNERYPQPKTVFYMDPAPGTPIREGSTVRVRLSLGSRMLDVPDVRGLRLAEARSKLEQVGLQIDPTIRRESNRGIEEGMIIKTDPGPWERVERGSPITLTVSTGSERPDRPVVDASELTPNTWTLSFEVMQSDSPVMVRVEMTDARGEPQVIFEEERPGGEGVSLDPINGFGKQATFRVFFNNNLEMTFPNRKGAAG